MVVVSPADRQTKSPLRKLPATARTAAREKAAERRGRQARDQFSRTFADVLSGRYGGRWVVQWERPDRAPLSPDRDRRSVSGEE